MYLYKDTPKYYCMYCGNTYDENDFYNFYFHVKKSHFPSLSISVKVLGTCFICGEDSSNLVKHVLKNHERHCPVCATEDVFQDVFPRCKCFSYCNNDIIHLKLIFSLEKEEDSDVDR